MTRPTDLLPSLAVALAGAAWGLFWLPFRAFDDAGLEGIWASLAFFVGGVAVMLPFALWRWRLLRADGLPLLVTGLFTGAAFSLYATSLLMTEVVRALLLFYVTPLWSTLLGALLLGERITLGRALALLLGAAGLLVILGLEDGFPLPRNIGDWMALLSGIFWAYGSLRVYRDPDAAPFESVFTFFVSGMLVTAAMLLLPFEGLGSAPTQAVIADLLPWLLLMVVLFFLPSMFLVLWGASVLSPGRVGILLMGEVVIGVFSAALLADEPFGLREALGAVLIIVAGTVEVLQRKPFAARRLESTGATGS